MKQIGAEQAVIAAMLNEPVFAARGVASCEPEDFTNPLCRELFTVMKSLVRKNVAADSVSVAQRLGMDRCVDVVNAADCFWLPSSFEDYVTMLKAARRKRLAAEGIRLIAEELKNGGCEDPAEALGSLKERVSRVGAPVMRPIGDMVDGAFAAMGETPSYPKTGFASLDRNIGGLRPGTLCVVAGRPSMGKSTFAMNIAANLAAAGGSVAYFPLEDGAASLARRMLLARARTGREDLVKEAERGGATLSGRVLRAGEEMRAWKLYVDSRCDGRLSSIAAAAYGVRARFGSLDLVVVDYLGFVESGMPPNIPEHERVAEVTRRLKRLAADLGCCVMLLCQLNRAVEMRERKEPMLPDLRASGAIEQDADVILFPFRPGVYDLSQADANEATVVVAKNRDGETGELKGFVWHPGEYRFTEG